MKKLRVLFCLTHTNYLLLLEAFSLKHALNPLISVKTLLQANQIHEDENQTLPQHFCFLTQKNPKKYEVFKNKRFFLNCMFFVVFIFNNLITITSKFRQIKKFNFMTRYLLMIAMILYSTLSHAQTLTVKGTVTDAATGEVLIGVSVVVKDSSRGDTTDFDGNYSINGVPSGSILVFSYIGYKTKEVTVTQATLDVTLEESAEKLDEIVVIGYGTQRKKEVTGAVSVISSKSIEDLKPVRVEQALQGQVAGVNIAANSGAPGSASNIRIRGISTNGNNNPLILVDGARVEDLSVVNPSEIESINVLKDVTAGIYGVQAANGVILITTKTGRKETDAKFSFNTYMAIQQTTREIPMLNATEYALLANEAFAANGEPLPFPSVSNLGQGTNWQDEVFQTAAMYGIDFGATKGTEKSALSFNLSILDQNGIVGGEKSRFNRRNVRLNYDYDITKDLKLNTASSWTNVNKSSLPENTLGSVLFNALNMPSTIPVYDANGDFSLPPPVGTGIEVANPLAQVDFANNITTTNRFSGSYGLSYKFLEYFSAESRLQFNYSTVRSRSYSPVAFFGNGSVFNNQINQLSIFQQTYKDYLWDTFIKYERVFGEHDVKLLLGTSFSQSVGINDINSIFQNPSIDGLYYNVIKPNIDVLQLTGLPRQFFDSRLQSYFVRAQYSYKGKYLLSAVLRRDGASNFGPKNKFGYFPSVSLGWNISDEEFLSDSETITSLKLRTSYGVIGNNRISSSFGFISLLNGESTYVFNDLLLFGTALGQISNPEIRWEKQKPFDVGFDLTLFGELDITVDYFNKITEDLLLTPQVSGILGAQGPGASAPVVNAGSIENKGFEFSVGWRKTVNDDFNFSVNYNLTTLKNNVLFVGNSTGFIPGGSFGVGQEPPSRMEAGFPIGYFYGLQTNGIFQNQAEVDAHATQANAAPGDLRYVDRNGDGVIDGKDRTYIGDPIADATMGLNLTLNYKDFDFSMYAFAQIGNEIVRNYERNLPLTNRSVYFLDRWRGEGTSNTHPRVTTGANGNSLFSDFYVEDGSFVRLQNIQFGYTVKPESLEKTGFDKVRFYLSADNLFTLTKYRGYDPTTSVSSPIGSGIDQGFYPNPKTFSLGLNVNF